VLAQPEMEKRRCPLVSIPPFRAIPRHGCVPAVPASVSPGQTHCSSALSGGLNILSARDPPEGVLPSCQTHAEIRTDSRRRARLGSRMSSDSDAPHPMYLGASLVFIGGALLRGFISGLLLGLAITGLLVVRIFGEETLLALDLEGYRAYLARKCGTALCRTSGKHPVS